MNSKPLINQTLTDEYFDEMSWHDVKIHAIAFDSDNFQLLLDIDYICEWIPKGKRYLFKVAPATLVFRNVHDFIMSTSGCDLIILDIYRDNPVRPHNSSYIDEQTEYDWSFDLASGGEVSFKSTGYTQFIRQQPVTIKRQSMELDERAGISFNTQ